MRRTMIFVATLLPIAYSNGLAQETNVELLIAEVQPDIQEQIKRTYTVFRSTARDDLKTNCEAFGELQKLKDITKDKGEIVKQLAIFTATTESEEDSHVMLVGIMLDFLDLPPSIPIRVLAPYLDADNRQLRDLARMWFYYHDSHERIHGRPPLGSVNYYDYMVYVRSKTFNYEEIPDGFVEDIYQRHPDRALLVFYYGSKQVGRPREILWGEHVVSNALWLKENGFDEPYQKALPEAANELAKLSKYDEWWARLYVAEMMRQYPVLRQPAVVEQLRMDRNALVSKVARATKE